MVPIAAYLVVERVGARHVVALLGTGQRYTIGRAPNNQVVVEDDRASRVHAEIFLAADGWTIRDLDSRNGTLLAGRPIEAETLLNAGDVIAIGLTELRYCEGDLPDDAGTGSATDVDRTGEMPADVQAWRSSIRHRRTASRLLEDIREAADRVPRVGRAAAALCRLSFALGRADDLTSSARQALDTAVHGVGAAAGVVLLPRNAADIHHAGGGREPVAAVASVPDPWPEPPLPAGAIDAVLGGDEAVLATFPVGAAAGTSTISAPIRAHGRAVGVLHVEAAPGERSWTADDLEFVLAVCDALGLAIENLSTRESLSTRLARTADENGRLRRRLGEDVKMVVVSPVLQGIMAQVQRVAATKVTVLVRGESGVGKELIARAIHEASDRKAAPFICLNCAALTETLLESELFGHEKGAFTGATERKIGKFESAHRGTLMLDEIGEMSPSIQAKFLRVLEGHPFERVGGSTRVQVDVRVVAATNRDLEAAVSAGEFRRDLYFRLKVVEILVPPLRRRPEDIEAIAAHYLERFAAEDGRRVRGFSDDALAALRAHHWPGNIRELRNCVERAVVLAQEEWIGAEDVALSPISSAGDTDRGGGGRKEKFVPLTIEELERRHIMATLEAVGGNKTKAAAILGIERSTLDRKLARWAGG
ncbi:MAG: sigma 54-interacting transcriptional regulator [Planctomycetia bacterium]